MKIVEKKEKSLLDKASALKTNLKKRNLEQNTTQKKQNERTLR